MEENKPLLSDEDEQIAINTENSSDLPEIKNSEDNREETELKEDVSESNVANTYEESKVEEEHPELDAEKEEDYVVSDNYKREVIAPTQEEIQKLNAEKKEENSSKKNNISLIVTLVLTALVAYLLVKTCINFYYGFRYKDYVPEETNTTQQP